MFGKWIEAKISGNPLFWQRHLKKISRYIKIIPANVNQGTVHLFIENPLKGENLIELFSTHPRVEKRIERLFKLARKFEFLSKILSNMG